LGQIWCASDFHYSCMQSCTTSFTFSQDFCPSSVLLSPMHYQFTFSQDPNHALQFYFLPRFLLVIISTSRASVQSTGIFFLRSGEEKGGNGKQ
jgi:hypothetical protein